MMTLKVKLNATTTKELKQEVSRQLERVISEKIFLEDAEMERLIWRMTYNPEEAYKELGFPKVNKREQTIIRGEMVRCYRGIKPDWTYGRRNGVETVERINLLAALDHDQFTYDTVMSHIKRRAEYGEMYDMEGVQKTLRCLKSKRPESQFGGIRRLGFNKREANFLKNAAYDMSKVLEAMTGVENA